MYYFVTTHLTKFKQKNANCLKRTPILPLYIYLIYEISVIFNLFDNKAKMSYKPVIQITCHTNITF